MSSQSLTFSIFFRYLTAALPHQKTGTFFIHRNVSGKGSPLTAERFGLLFSARISSLTKSVVLDPPINTMAFYFNTSARLHDKLAVIRHFRLISWVIRIPE